MAVCPECGGEVPDGAPFCLTCGSKIEAGEAKAPEEAPKEAEKTAGSYTEEGMGLYNSKKFGEAIASFDEALKLEPKNAKALFNKGLALKDWGIAIDDTDKVKSSIEIFNKSLEIDPKNGEIWYHKGMVQGLLEEFDNAVESFDTALKLDPGNATYEMMYTAAKEQAREAKAPRPPAEEEAEEEALVGKKKAPSKIMAMKIPFPKNYTALITGPPGVGKYDYCLHLAKQYLKQGENVVYITTEKSPQEIKDRLKEEGFDLDTYEGSQFLFIDVYSYSTGAKYDKGLHVDNPANLSLINVHLASAATTLGKPMRIFFDSLSTLFLHASVGEIKKFVGVLSSRAKTEYGFVLNTLQEEMHDKETVMAMRSMVDAVIETEFEEGPPLERRFRVHHAKGLKMDPTWYVFDVEGGFNFLGEVGKMGEAAAAAGATVTERVIVEKAIIPKYAVVGLLAVVLIAVGGFFFMKGGGEEGMKVQTTDLYSLTLPKTVNVGGEEVEAFIDVKNRIDSEAPTKGWIVINNPFYKIEMNMDHPHYRLYDKVKGHDLLVFNDKVESKTDWLTASTLGYADVDGENLQAFSSMAIHDQNGVEYQVVPVDEEEGFILLTTKGWDYQTADRKEGYDVEGEELFGIFADKPYFIDAVEVSNLQGLGYVQQIGFRNPDEIVKDWVLRGDYDSGVLVGGDMEHLNKELAVEWSQVQTIGGIRKAWHTGSATFSKMFPDHAVIGNKLGGAVIFSLPKGKFRFDDSLGAMGDQVVLEFLILVENPEKAIAFTSEPVNREAFFYDLREYATVPGYKESMLELCGRYGLDCPTDGVLNTYDWQTKRFAYVITLVDDWYDAARNQPKGEVISLANEGLEEFKNKEDLIYNQMVATKPLAAKFVGR